MDARVAGLKRFPRLVEARRIRVARVRQPADCDVRRVAARHSSLTSPRLSEAPAKLRREPRDVPRHSETARNRNRSDSENSKTRARGRGGTPSQLDFRKLEGCVRWCSEILIKLSTFARAIERLFPRNAAWRAFSRARSSRRALSAIH